MAIDWTQPFATKCPHCGEVISMEVKAVWDAWDPGWESPPQQWTAATCPECSGAALYLQEQLGEPFPDGWDGRYQMHPAQARRLSSAVPRAIRNDHAETTKCIESKLYTAAGVMTRRMLEGVCHDHGYNKGTLFAKLKKMKTDGVIDDRLYDWADICRTSGIRQHTSTSPPLPEPTQKRRFDSSRRCWTISTCSARGTRNSRTAETTRDRGVSMVGDCFNYGHRLLTDPNCPAPRKPPAVEGLAN